jgi:tetratricopeptide (TPR) repeat protein
MIVNRVARRFAVALASGFLVASHLAGQDALTRAKDLYAAAAYDDALAVLDQLKLDSSSPDVVEAGQYRAFCLLALGRSDEGRKAIAGIVEADPLFQPAETQMSPRLVTVFRDVRKQLLPRIVQQSYAEAKAAFDRKELEAATIAFDRVLLLLNDPDLPASSGTTDLRMLATGFRDLSKVAPAPPPSRVAPPPPNIPLSAKPANASGPPRTYGPNDAGGHLRWSYPNSCLRGARRSCPPHAATTRGRGAGHRRAATSSRSPSSPACSLSTTRSSSRPPASGSSGRRQKMACPCDTGRWWVFASTRSD